MQEIIDTRCILGVMDWFLVAKARATDLNVTQDELAKIFGVSTRGAVGHYLLGRREPPIATLPRLADRLGLTLDELLRGKPAAPKSQSARPSAAMLASAVRLARGAVEAKGMDDFSPETDEGDAELLALALEEILEGGIGEATDSDVLRFARKVNKAGVSNGAGSDRQDGGIGRNKGEPEARAKGSASRGKPRKSA